MFDLQEAFSSLGGQRYSFADLRSAVSEIRIRHLAELPPEVGVDDLIRLGRQNFLIQEDEDGTMYVQQAELEHR
ncbi:MAG TPA: hypothetical protein VHU44_04330 [Acidobacteriaceae bacterium]|jgi:hypothetical protein|nr:hypothetical protein [Acidobacteriaceae bacterium]